jgi:type IV pilus assembly protein PilM
MAVQPGVWGIDLGQCALKALRLESVDGQITATAFDYVEHPKILSQPDADPDQLTREALDKFLSRNTLRGDMVAISVPGQSGLARFVKLPPVEEKKIVDIVKFEAKQQIPFNLDEVVWDYQKIGSGLVTDGFALETEIGLFAMKRDMVSRYLQHFKDVNVEVHVVQMAPLSLCNYAAYDLLQVNPDGTTANPEAGGKKRAVVVLDIGADSSNLVVTDGQRIIWQRPIPLGGNHFTRALTKDLKLTFAKAEHLKRNASKSPDLKKILTALKPVLNDFVGEVQRSLGYFTNTHRDAQVEYMMGLGNAFRLPGLQKFLAEKLQLDVRKLQKLERLQGDTVTAAPAFTENVLSFAVAYGLALQGLNVSRLQTNLLPPEIRTERMIRAKKPWVAAAAAALLAGVILGPHLGYAFDLKSVNVTEDPLKKAIDESNSVKSTADRLEREFKAKQEEADKEEKAVRSIIAGQEERLNWLQLNKFVSDALPRPDGSNLTPEARREFFDVKGQDAFARYQARLTKIKSGPRDPADNIDPHLVQFNIESFDARYIDDLGVMWTKLTGGTTPQVRKQDVRPAVQFEAPPKGGGWLVEMRGYTYHTGSRRFVLEGLVDALARAGVKTLPPAGGTPASGTTPAPTAPATGAATAAAEPQSKDPVIDRVSHVMLFKASTPDTGGGDLINTSGLASLVGGGSASGPGGSAPPGGLGGPSGGMGGMSPPPSSGMGGMSPPPSSGMGGAMGAAGGDAGTAVSSGRSSWKPLLGGAGAGGLGGGAGMMGPTIRPGGGTGMMGPTLPPGGGSGMMGPTLPPGGAGGMKPPVGGGDTFKPSPAGQVARTEFIVLFVWNENAPSDQYLPPPEAAPAGGGMMGGGGMSPPPGSAPPR